MPVKLAAERLGVPVCQPVTLRDSGTIDQLLSVQADVICVAAYGLILPPAALSAARLGAINVHASLLPRWRGAAPIQRAILAGDRTAGVSIMRMEEGLDTGPYCLQGSVPVDDKNASALTSELGVLGAALLVSALHGIADGTAVWTPQAQDGVTYADKVSKSDVAPDPALSAHDNLLRVRASSSAAPARMLLAGRGVTLLEATASSDRIRAGAVENTDDGILLGASSGGLLVTRLKPDGKAEMEASAWARGARLDSCAVWERPR
jgi:methionyl-tRNA formyltransferase